MRVIDPSPPGSGVTAKRIASFTLKVVRIDHESPRSSAAHQQNSLSTSRPVGRCDNITSLGHKIHPVTEGSQHYVGDK